VKAIPPSKPLTAVGATSSIASINGALTGIVTVAESQLSGYCLSQILYTIEYEPAGVPAGTDI